jgi:transposase
MKDIKVLGIDLAKNVFQVHGVNAAGKGLLRKRLSREKLIEFMTNCSPCLVGIEACGGAHYWARLFTSMGHNVKIMSPQFVKPYVKANKNDAKDAEAIAEAVTRPTMRFVAIKTTEQQDVLLLHRSRELAIKQRTAQSNQIRGYLAEYGIVIAQGLHNIKKLPEILDGHDDKISAQAKTDSRCVSIQDIEGVGPITASAIVATIGDPAVFKNGREVSAWLGLVPKQQSSGNKVVLGSITKRGDRYVRMLLIHGARAVIKTCGNKTDNKSEWVNKKRLRSSYNSVAVALANKNARTIWAMLSTGESYRKSVGIIAR